MKSFDTIAHAYESLERITLANTLQSARTHCLPYLSDQKRGLLIGDGDGRFSERLLETLPEMHVDSIDISGKMLALAKQRVGRNAERFNPIQKDALLHEYPKYNYDFIGLHFCLDCFTQPEIDTLLPRVTASLRANGLIAYSDFQATNRWQATVVRFLYFCFRQTAALKSKKLPDVVWEKPIRSISRAEFAKGLVFSNVLQKTSTAAVEENHRVSRSSSRALTQALHCRADAQG